MHGARRDTYQVVLFVITTCAIPLHKKATKCALRKAHITASSYHALVIPGSNDLQNAVHLSSATGSVKNHYFIA